MNRFAVVLVVVALGVSGCGYQLVRYPAADRSDPSARRVAITTLANDSFDPGYEFVITDALLAEFHRRRALRVVKDPDDADLVIGGRIRPIHTRRRSPSSVVLSLEYEVLVELDLEVTRRGAEADEEVVLDRGVLTATELYLTSVDAEAQRKNREEALRRVADVLAVRVHDVLYEAALP